MLKCYLPKLTRLLKMQRNCLYTWLGWFPYHGRWYLFRIIYHGSVVNRADELQVLLSSNSVVHKGQQFAQHFHQVLFDLGLNVHYFNPLSSSWNLALNLFNARFFRQCIFYAHLLNLLRVNQSNIHINS